MDSLRKTNLCCWSVALAGVSLAWGGQFGPRYGTDRPACHISHATDAFYGAVAHLNRASSFYLGGSGFESHQPCHCKSRERVGLSWGNVRPREQRSLLRVALCYTAYQTRNEIHLVWSGCWFPCRDSNVKDSLQTLSSSIVPWCIGCTGVFDTLSPGPNPGGTTKQDFNASLGHQPSVSLPS